MNGSKTFKALLALALVLAVVGLFTPRDPGDPLSPFAYQTKFYVTSGGDKAVVASGGELEMQSGSTVDVQSGTTTNIAVDPVFEGATADDYETTLAITDPTADRTVTITDATGTVMLSTLATNGPEGVNGVWAASNALAFEGATGDAYETSVTVTDPTADRTLTLPNVSGTVHVNEATQNLTANTGTFSGDITLENDETISNATDTVIQIGGFLALTEGAVQVVTYGSTLTCVASFQPITSTAVITNVVIADGVVAGQIVVISNENAGDDITILESGSNLQAGGDVTLTGGAKDLLTLLWDGAEWIRLAFFDN